MLPAGTFTPYRSLSIVFVDADRRTHAHAQHATIICGSCGMHCLPSSSECGRTRYACAHVVRPVYTTICAFSARISWRTSSIIGCVMCVCVLCVWPMTMTLGDRERAVFRFQINACTRANARTHTVMQVMFCVRVHSTSHI